MRVEIDPARLRELGSQQQVRPPNHPLAQTASYTEENYMNPPPPPDPYKKEKDFYPKLQSNYRDEFQVKDIKTQD